MDKSQRLVCTYLTCEGKSLYRCHIDLCTRYKLAILYMNSEFQEKSQNCEMKTRNPEEKSLNFSTYNCEFTIQKNQERCQNCEKIIKKI